MKVVVRTEVILIELRIGTGSVLEDVTKVLKKFLELPRIMFWSNILCPVIFFVSRQENLWKIMMHKLNVGIAISAF